MAMKLYRISINTTAMIEAETETEAVDQFLADLNEDDVIAECDSDDDEEPFENDVRREEKEEK